MRYSCLLRVPRRLSPTASPQISAVKLEAQDYQLDSLEITFDKQADSLKTVGMTPIIKLNAIGCKYSITTTQVHMETC
jgi:hypothetical protein